MYEDFVSYELAVKLKEKGFNRPCCGYYHVGKGDDSFEACISSDFLNSLNEYRVGAPTISQVLKWLREEKKIHICIYPTKCNFDTDIYSNVGRYYHSEADRWMLGYRKEVTFTDGITWDFAMEQALKYVLDKLI